MGRSGTVLGPLAALPDGEVTEVEVGRDSLLLLRRGPDLRAFRNLCPHQWLPLTYRSPKILSADGRRLRCSNHGAEFSAEDGRPFHATLTCGLEPVPIQVDAEGQVVLPPRAYFFSI
ncbi:MAG TPA: Rieske (2Fe-2S) protein [Geminicoccaceae bacterium]|nr:Rieske (2Fe-2S) protein [Geminicoccaceae bacterium]